MNIPYNVVETIKVRRSVRTYEKRPVAPELLDKIKSYISSLSNPFGVDVHIHEIDKDLHMSENGEKLGTYGVIKGATNFLGLSVGKVPMGLVAAGYQFENLVLYITSLGLGTVWLAATFSRSKFQSAMGIPDSDYFPAICPFGYPEKIRFFEKVMRMGIKSDARKPWKDLFFDGDFSKPLDEEKAGEYALALEMLRLAPSATNAQPWRVLKIGDTFHFYIMYKESTREDDKLIKQVDLGIGICHFDLTMQQDRNIQGVFDVKAPEGIKVPDEFHYIVSWTPKK